MSLQAEATLFFLKGLLEANITDFNSEDGYLFSSLQSALNTDGYALGTIDSLNTRQYLRGLREHLETPGDPAFVWSLVAVFICIICAGLASGLTQGLLSLDYMEMTIKSRSGTPLERKYAKKLIPVISQHHLLLVTLMLWNASATEALPIFLNHLVPGYMAIIMSVTLVLFVGEIIPASILTGPNQLFIASKLLPLVYFVLFIFFPIAYPISKMLDWIIGHDHGMTMYNRGELNEIVNLQHEEGLKRAGGEHADSVHYEEVAIIGGALKFREMAVEDVMTGIDDTFMIPASEKLSYKTLYDIFKSGYSRIPVYDHDRNDIIGLILAKDLIFVDAEDETPVRNFIELFGRKPASVWVDDTLGETLSKFKTERAHMAIVKDVEEREEGDPVYSVVGIITLEDIIEEILGTEIVDETDNMADSDLMKMPQFRDMDFARLKLLHNKMSEDVLTEDEVRGIVAHLYANVHSIQHLYENNLEGLTELVRNGKVITMKRKTPEAAGSKPVQDDMIYRRGKMSNMCCLVLSGKLTVLAGKDEFMSEKGPWSVLGSDALTHTEGTYIPDYIAYVSSDTIRFLSLSLQQQDRNAGSECNTPTTRSGGGSRSRSTSVAGNRASFISGGSNGLSGGSGGSGSQKGGSLKMRRDSRKWNSTNDLTKLYKMKSNHDDEGDPDTPKSTGSGDHSVFSAFSGSSSVTGGSNSVHSSSSSNDIHMHGIACDHRTDNHANSHHKTYNNNNSNSSNNNNNSNNIRSSSNDGDDNEGYGAVSSVTNSVLQTLFNVLGSNDDCQYTHISDGDNIESDNNNHTNSGNNSNTNNSNSSNMSHHNSTTGKHTFKPTNKFRSQTAAAPTVAPFDIESNTLELERESTPLITHKNIFAQPYSSTSNNPTINSNAAAGGNSSNNSTNATVTTPGSVEGSGGSKKEGRKLRFDFK